MHNISEGRRLDTEGRRLDIGGKEAGFGGKEAGHREAASTPGSWVGPATGGGRTGAEEPAGVEGAAGAGLTSGGRTWPDNFTTAIVLPASASVFIDRSPKYYRQPVKM